VPNISRNRAASKPHATSELNTRELISVHSWSDRLVVVQFDYYTATVILSGAVLQA
jgi:hypothetical protein